MLLKDVPPSAVRLPWEHRRHLGVLIAFWRTVWIVCFRTRSLAQELNRPVSYSDARRFWALVLLHAWAPFALALAALLILSRTSSWAWLRDYENVLWTEAYLPVPLVVMILPALLLFFVLATGVPTYFAHQRSLPTAQQNRAIALAYYAAAPLAIMPLVVLFAAASDVLEPFWRQAAFAVAGVTWLLAIALFVLWWLCTISILVQTTNRGLLAGGLLAFGWPILLADSAVLAVSVSALLFLALLYAYSLTRP